jgi:glycosyltransferase 2 family protein
VSGTRLALWLKIGVSLVLLGLLAYWIDLERLWSALRLVGLWQPALAWWLIVFAYLSNALRLRGLQRQAGLVMPDRLFWGSYGMGLAGNYALPSGVGGDAVRVLFLVRRGYAAGPLVVAGLVDRLFGLLGLLAMAGLALVSMPQAVPLEETRVRLMGAALLMGAGMAWWGLPRLGVRILQQRGEPMQDLRNLDSGTMRRSLQGIWARPGPLLGWVALSLLSHLLVILSYASCGWSLLPEIAWSQYFIAIPGVMLMHALPISLGGLGVREVGTVGLLVWMGAGEQAALTLSVIYLGISWLSLLPGVLLAYRLLDFRRRAKDG